MKKKKKKFLKIKKSLFPRGKRNIKSKQFSRASNKTMHSFPLYHRHTHTLHTELRVEQEIFGGVGGFLLELMADFSVEPVIQGPLCSGLCLCLCLCLTFSQTANPKSPTHLTNSKKERNATKGPLVHNIPWTQQQKQIHSFWRNAFAQLLAPRISLPGPSHLFPNPS